MKTPRDQPNRLRAGLLPPRRWVTRGLATCLAALLAVLAVPGSASAERIPRPDADPFYRVPAGLAHTPNGTVLASRPVRPRGLILPIPAKAWQVKYKTLDQAGHPSAYVTTVLVPRSPWRGEGARPLLSYQAATDALSTKCAPSYALRAGPITALTSGLTVAASNPAQETLNIAQAVSKGYAVAVPDWEGPRADWVGAEGAAHGVLDGIRAVRSFAPAAIDKQAPIGLVGYSGGALATDWAVQTQPTYAPELRFVATALGGTPADISRSIASFKANPIARGAVPLLYAALDRSYPQWRIGDQLSPRGRAAVAASQHDCLLDALIRNVGVDPDSWEAAPGSLFKNRRLNAEIAGISPVKFTGTPQTPILFYHSSIDELAPIDEMRRLAARYCRAGLPVHVSTSPAGEHIAFVLTGFPIALSYLDRRFAGERAPSDC